MKLAILILANALLRIAGGAGGILVGLFLSDAASRGAPVDAALVGLVGAVSFGAELLASIPMGILSDALAPKWLLTSGAIIGGVATQLFGLSGHAGAFVFSRGLEGVGVAAAGPPLLAQLTDGTAGNRALRARAMSFYELSFLAGIALGGLLGSQLWRAWKADAFALVAVLYGISAGLLYSGAADGKSHGREAAIEGLAHAMREPHLRRLAPIWLCMNTIVGLWLGPTLTFLLTQPADSGQFLAGIFVTEPDRVGWMLLGYALVFGIGVTAWSFVLPRMSPERALRIGLLAMPGVCAGLFLLNHISSESASTRWSIGGFTALLIIVESGFTPAALSLLAGAIGSRPGRGAAMGIYSVLLSLGAIAGSLLAAFLGQRFSVDGLISGTLALAVVALALSRNLGPGLEKRIA